MRSALRSAFERITSLIHRRPGGVVLDACFRDHGSYGGCGCTERAPRRARPDASGDAASGINFHR